MPESNKLKLSYFENNHFYKLTDYLENEDFNYKVSIIYTFSPSDIVIEGVELSSSQMISEIQSEQQLKNLIFEKLNQKNLNKNNQQYVFLQFESSESIKLSFIVPFVINDYSEESNKFIFIIHVKRNFDEQEIHISNIFDVFLKLTNYL